MKLKYLLFSIIMGLFLLEAQFAHAAPSDSCQDGTQAICSHTYQFVWTGSAWLNQDFAAMSGSSLLVAYGNESAPLLGEVVYIDLDQHIYQLVWTGSVWLVQDLTIMSGSNTPLNAVINTY